MTLIEPLGFEAALTRAQSLMQQAPFDYFEAGKSLPEAELLYAMVYALDGLTIDGVTLDTAVETLNDDGSVSNDITTVRFHKLGLWAQMLHTSASPPVAYLFLIIGLALLIFEFFTAGIGVAGIHFWGVSSGFNSVT